MSESATMYIASPDADEIERVFAFDPGFFVAGSGRGAETLAQVRKLQPHVLVIDSVLDGADGIDTLRKIGHTMPAPPRTVMLFRTETGKAAADHACRYPCGERELLRCAREAAAEEEPALARPWRETRKEIARGLLTRLGTAEKLKGRRYLAEAAALCACAPDMTRGTRLYAYLGERFHASPAAVEKAVRTAIESTWLNGNWREIQALFGLSVDADRGKPTNNECIAMLAEHVRDALLAKMLQKAKEGETRYDF